MYGVHIGKTSASTPSRREVIVDHVRWMDVHVHVPLHGLDIRKQTWSGWNPILCKRYFGKGLWIWFQKCLLLNHNSEKICRNLYRKICDVLSVIPSQIFHNSTHFNFQISITTGLLCQFQKFHKLPELGVHNDVNNTFVTMAIIVHEKSNYMYSCPCTSWSFSHQCGNGPIINFTVCPLSFIMLERVAFFYSPQKGPKMHHLVSGYKVQFSPQNNVIDSPNKTKIYNTCRPTDLFTKFGGILFLYLRLRISKVKTTCGDTMWKSLSWVVISSEKELEVTTRHFDQYALIVIRMNTQNYMLQVSLTWNTTAKQPWSDHLQCSYMYVHVHTLYIQCTCTVSRKLYKLTLWSWWWYHNKFHLTHVYHAAVFCFRNREM